MIKTILYIAFQYENGKKENGKALNYKGWCENFIKLGYEVDTLFYEDYTKEELQDKIINTANTLNPDLIFFVLQRDQIDVATLKKLKEDGFLTTNFFGDDTWRFNNFTSKYASYFWSCITTDKFSIDKYIKIGQNNIIYSQWGSLESDIAYNDIKYKYSVSFVGGANSYRKWFVNELFKRGIKVECFGNGWSNGRVTYEQMEKIFLTSKVNLNISNSTNYDIRYLLSNLKAFLSTVKAMIKGGKNNSQIKARNFEIPVQGGFQLTDYVPTIEDYFEIGKELICYNNIDEAESLINYYLIHENEREAIKLSGIKKAREKHTFNNRIIEFMHKIEDICDR